MPTTHPRTGDRTLMRSHRRYLSGALGLALLAPLTPAAAAATPAAPAPQKTSDCAGVAWMDTSRSADQRARALLAASTQHQKYRWLVEQAANSPRETEIAGVTYPAQVPCTPTVVYTDGPDGVRFTEGVTAFPAPIALASTWNEGLAREKFAAQAEEAFDKGRNVVLGPGLASSRTPLSGRTPEYLGEDPLLTGLLTAAGVNGIQEGNPDKPVLATLKHYVGNEQELDRAQNSSNIDERTLRQIYDLPFEIALERSSPESVMCSYNQVNGVHSCENPLLDDVLKDELGFDGYVMSDFGAVHSTAPSLGNGLDQELNRPVFYTPQRLDAALAAGEITQEQIDEAAFRVVRSYVRGGLFDAPLPAVPVADASTRAHKATAREVAEQGSVLLKNDGVLPLAPGRGDTIAVIGATASSTPTSDGTSAVD
ncbi:glycoside hydrolase family 3 protein, partial [Kineococcus glutinatus]|uniref:glycoside hydrolase family 3 protein n=1 Tax=Kineococcus glutinatus TaxID=1070872 RepID=UPI0031EAF7EE